MKTTFNAKDYRVFQTIPLKWVYYEFTRPNNTTPYAAFDSVNTSATAPIVFKIEGVNRGIIMNAKFSTGKTGDTIPAGTFKVRFFRGTYTPVNDNDPAPMLWANRANGYATVDFTVAGGGTGSDAASANLQNLNIQTFGDIFFTVEVVSAAYTPVAEQGYRLDIGIMEVA